MLLSIFIRYDLQLKWYTSRGLLTEYDNLKSTGWWQSLVVEFILVIIAPYPGLDKIQYHEYNKTYDTYLTYDLNDILLFFIFIRTYLLIRYILIMTHFNNPRSQRICSMNGCEADTMFAIKALMKQKPYTILFVSMVISTFIFGY